MRPLILSALVSLSITLWGAVLVPSPLVLIRQGRDEATFRIAVDINLVVFNVAVADGSGRPISLLRANDFTIVEENRLQKIAFFTAEEGAATVGLIIDNSGSMRAKRADVVNAALAFTRASRPDDEMFVVNFNETVYLGLPPTIKFTNDLYAIRSALLGTTADGLTALYDALAVGIEHLKTGTRDRKVLVVLSDGGDNASRRRLDEVLEIAKRSSATIYTIGIYDEDDLDRNPGVLRRIAKLSGGRAYFPDSLSDLNGVWREIAGEIRNQYTIGYHSSNASHDGKYRKVKITARLSGRSLRVVTRDGYFAPAGESIAK
jgi:Ca-activated chloride channel family protein